jgi:predicted amidohydrolase
MNSYKTITVVQKLSKKTINGTLNMMMNLIKEYKNSDMIVFPEMIIESSKYKTKARIKQLRIKRIESIYKVEEQLTELSGKYKIDIIFGSMDKLFDMMFNTGILISNGKLRRYRKVHVHWTEKFERGKVFKVFNSSCGKIGILICFDAAFPEASRILALKGAKIIVILANTPNEFDKEYMRIRSRSIALDNQVYVVYCNKPKPLFNGHSAIIGPRGNVIYEAGFEEKIFTKRINLEEIAIWRKEEKIYQNRIPELYKDIVK